MVFENSRRERLRSRHESQRIIHRSEPQYTEEIIQVDTMRRKYRRYNNCLWARYNMADRDRGRDLVSWPMWPSVLGDGGSALLLVCQMLTLHRIRRSGDKDSEDPSTVGEEVRSR